MYSDSTSDSGISRLFEPMLGRVAGLASEGTHSAPTIADPQFAQLLVESRELLNRSLLELSHALPSDQYLELGRTVDSVKRSFATLTHYAALFADAALPAIPREGLRSLVRKSLETLKALHSPAGYEAFSAEMKSSYYKFISDLYFQAVQVDFECERLQDLCNVHEAEVRLTISHPIFTKGAMLDPKEFMASLPPPIVSAVLKLLSPASPAEHEIAADHIRSFGVRHFSLQRALVYCMLQGQAPAHAITLLRTMTPLPEDLQVIVATFANHEFIPEDLALRARELTGTVRAAA